MVDKDENRVAWDDDSGDGIARITFTPDEAGSYYIGVDAVDGYGGHRISIAEVGAIL